MSTILEKIADIEAEMARTQKNKATSAHLGLLKAKLAKLRRELITPKSQGGASEQGFEVAKVSVIEYVPYQSHFAHFQIFLGKSKLSTTKKCKTATFSRMFFTIKKFPNFSREIKAVKK